MNLDYHDFVRKPFIVRAVQVTNDNIDELAKDIGKVQFMSDGTRYISVDKRLVPNVFKVKIGWWVTKMGDNVRCYNEEVFHREFADLTPAIKEWVDDLASDEFEDDDSDDNQMEVEVIQP